MVSDNKKGSLKLAICNIALIVSSITSFTRSDLAQAESDLIRGFNLKTCNQSYCYNVSASSSFRSFNDQIFSLEKIFLFIMEKSNLTKKISILSSDGYLDLQNNILVLRGIDTSKEEKEAAVYFNTGKISLFK